MSDHLSSRHKKRAWAAIRFAASAALLAVVLTEIDLPETGHVLARADWRLVIAAFFLLIVQTVYSAYKLMILIRCRSTAMTLRRMVRVVLISLFVGEFVPGTVGTELTRMVGIARDTGDPVLSFTAVLMDRIVGLTGLLIVVCVALTIYGHGPLEAIRYWALAGLFAVIGGWLAAMSRRFRRLMDFILKPRMLAKLRDKVAEVYVCMDAFRRRPGVLAWVLILAIGYNVLRALIVFVAARALGVSAPVWAFLVVVPMVIFLVQLPITIGGFGVRELGYVALLKTYGVPGSTALAISVLMLIMATGAELLPGALLLMLSKPRAPIQPEVSE